ncbi:MAG: NAD(P)H-dependent oxidoreductase subunit E [Deltaproteobacteria bacterium]|jgi:NADH:ubiquinone oxidoreductase subunit E|nr:NAD(P)H-dependent oxidoreductase subunit E [Deltaproteobacteria bacterium]
MEAESIAKLESVYSRYIEQEGNAISILQGIQDAFGYIPEKAVGWFSAKSGIPESKFFGIVTFYAQFYLKPRGKNVVTTCCGTVCHVKGGHRVQFQIHEELGLPLDEDTTRDGLITIERVACLGACSLAPVVVINDKVQGRMTPDKMVRQLRKLREKKP